MSPNRIPIALGYEDLVFCERVRELRWRNSRNIGREVARSVDRSSQQQRYQDLLGCVAELAFARFLGIEWDGSVNRFSHSPDVGEFDVRATELENGCLIIRDNDKPLRPFVLLTGEVAPAVMHLRGWIWGHEARALGTMRNPGSKRASLFVPQHKLRPIPPHEERRYARAARQDG